MGDMNWNMIGALAELFGAIGVFASLFYLAVQLKHNAAETRDATIQSIMELAIHFRAESYKGELAEIRMKANSDEALTPLESVKLEGYLSALFELTELVFVQHRKGKLDPEYFDAWELRTKAVMSVSRIQQFWSKTKMGYRRSFVEYIDGLMNTR
ncbi:MAG: hypothetical protein V3R35_09685 [Woeseiaceae bacterium]